MILNNTIQKISLKGGIVMGNFILVNLKNKLVFIET